MLEILGTRPDRPRSGAPSVSVPASHAGARVRREVATTPAGGVRGGLTRARQQPLVDFGVSFVLLSESLSFNLPVLILSFFEGKYSCVIPLHIISV
eukprot:COSAG02_NODE_721_length_18054_cov_3.613422_6_plen_96_part_00